MKSSTMLLAFAGLLLALVGCEVHVVKHDPPPPPPPCATCKNARVVGCGTCQAKGTVEIQANCGSCAGTGALRCGVCAGSGALACAKCKGTGDIVELGLGKKVEVHIQCKHCAGSGRLACGSCTQGKIGCGTCAGKGKVPQTAKCGTCAGTGKTSCPTCRGKR